MKAISRIVNFAGQMRQQLTALSPEEPLSKLSLIVLLLADLLLLSVLFDGLTVHRQQLVSPTEFVPRFCDQIYIKRTWQADNRLDNLQSWLLRHKQDKSPPEPDDMHASCRNVYQQFVAIYAEVGVLGDFEQRQRLQNQRVRLLAAFRQDENVVDTHARQTELAELTAELDELSEQINNQPAVGVLWQALSQITAEQGQQLEQDLERHEFWYPLKVLLWEAVFILPLLLAAYWWSQHSLKHNHRVQLLLASHLLVIVSIPIVFRVCRLVLDLLPRHFFEQLFNWLSRLHLTMLWHFTLIALTVGGAMLLIWFIQHKVFNPQKLARRRLARGACHACGVKLPDLHAAHCVFCGAGQRVECPKCSAQTEVAGEYCEQCGESLAQK